jgi:hypothetical protein
MAPQFTATSASCERALEACSARASNSLPVPLSPWISTEASLCAMSRASASSFSMRGLRVMMASRQASPGRSPGMSAPRVDDTSSARFTSSMRSAPSKGLVM